MADSQVTDAQRKNRGGGNRSRQELRKPGIVRAVPSGDTVSILDVETRPANAPPKEIQLTLLGLKAPLLGKRLVRDGKTVVEKDERWAWESREYLRTQLIGKSVVYRVEHEAGNRHYGEIWLDAQNLRFAIVRDGWADVVVKARKDGELREDDAELERLRDEAKEKGIGIWSTDKKGAVRTVNYRESIKGERADDLFDFFERMKNKQHKGIVEQVRTGSTLRVLLTGTMDSIQLQLAGIRSPSISGNDEAEPFAREARFFTEHLLLHRDVVVTIEGIDKYNNFFGTVVDLQNRNVSVNLVRMGLASVVEWSAGPKTDLNVYKEAERYAQENKLRMWKDYKGPIAPKAGAASKDGKKQTNEKGASETFTARVVEIVNASTITVRVNKGERGEVDRKISFSSIVVPRLMGPTKGGDEDGVAAEAKMTDEQRAKAEEERRQSQLAWEAKEFLRRMLIGKTVRCVFDYVRPSIAPKNAQEKVLPPKPFWSVYLKDRNVAIDLVLNGFADVVAHGPSEPRSADFQQLIIAEKSAQKAGKGKHAPRSKAVPKRVNDLTQQEPQKSAPFLNTLRRAGRVAAVVDYVFTGARFKLYVPSEEVLLCFVLQGLAVDRVTKTELSKQDKAKLADVPFAKLYPPTTPGNKALHLARDKFFQRDVQIEVDAVDKGGNFVGTLYLQGTPFGVELVEQGYAKVHHGSAQRLKEYPKLREAEESAKKSRLGVWIEYDPAAEAARIAEAQSAREAARAAQTEAAKLNVTVTEIVDGSNFWYQVVGEETRALEALMATLEDQKLEAAEPYTPKKGEIVAGQFTVDDHWYRAEVQKIQGDKVQLLYVDYGNVETVTLSRVRALPADFALSVLPRQAHHGRLAFIKAPSLSADYGVDAAALLKELVWDKTLVATVQFKEGQGADVVSYLSLGDPETKIPINAALVISGLARVQKSRTKSAFYERLREEEEKARKSRLNIWQYGDVDDDDDEL